jgi:hypothetical protein
VLDVALDGGIAQLADEIGPPILLLSGGIERIEGALPGRQRQRLAFAVA